MPFVEQIKNRQRARSLLEQCRTEPTVVNAVLDAGQGRLWVDQLEQPGAAWLDHGLTILAGDPDGIPESFAASQSHLIWVPSELNWQRWLQSRPGTLKTVTRQRFSAAALNIHYLRQLKSRLPAQSEIQPMTLATITRLTHEWALPVMDGFHSLENFLARSQGYLLSYQGQPVAVIYGAACAGEHIELEVETHPEYRRQGFATGLSAHCLLECLANGLVPEWATSSSASVRLARSLGLKPAVEYPLYSLD